MSHAALEVLEAWDLLDDEPRVARLDMRDWRNIGDALERGYQSGVPAGVLGSIGPGVCRGLRFVEGQDPFDGLVPHLLLGQCVWLPDPVFSLVARSGTRAWETLPDSGSPKLTGRKGIHTKVNTAWTCSPNDRLAYVRERMPP